MCDESIKRQDCDQAPKFELDDVTEVNSVPSVPVESVDKKDDGGHVTEATAEQHSAEQSAVVDASSKNADDESDDASDLSGKADHIEMMSETINGIASELQDLKALFVQQAKSNDLHRSSFERLHKEMLDYKENFLQKAQEPVYRSLIVLADDIDQILQQDAPVTVGDVEYLRNQLVEILYRQGVESYTTGQDIFDPVKQKVSVTETTEDEALHKHVVRSIRPGYALDGRMIRPENVVICSYQKQAVTEPQDKEDDSE